MREQLEEAFADDVKQKLAINRAVYAAGYGIDPRPYGQPSCPTAKQPARAVLPWVLCAAMAAGVTGAAIPLVMQGVKQPAPTETKPLKGTIRFWAEDGTEIKPLESKGGDP